MFDGSSEAGAFDARGVTACHIVRDLDTKKYPLLPIQHTHGLKTTT